MTIKLPPQYVNLPAWLVYSDLPKSVQVTAERIYGLAWDVARKRTQEENLHLPIQFPVTREELELVCGLERRQLFGHLRTLLKRGVLRYTYHKAAGIYVFTLPPRSEWPSPVLGEKSAENCTHLPIFVDDDLSLFSGLEHQQQPSLCVEGGCGGENEGAENCTHPKSFVLRRLEEMAIVEPTRSELADYPWATDDYALGWALWKQAHPNVGPGMIVANWRKAVTPPEVSLEELESASPVTATCSICWRVGYADRLCPNCGGCPDCCECENEETEDTHLVTVTR